MAMSYFTLRCFVVITTILLLLAKVNSVETTVEDFEIDISWNDWSSSDEQNIGFRPKQNILDDQADSNGADSPTHSSKV